MRKTILLDMDNTILDWDRGLIDILDIHLDIKNRKNWCIFKSFDSIYKKDIVNALSKKSFYYNLKPIKNSIKTIHKLEEDFNIYFVTSPPNISPDNACFDKVKWISKYFGVEYVKKLIITHDKTLIKGDYLIDDKPIIKGIYTPNWTHIIYSQSYNLMENKIRINNWDYSDIINKIKIFETN